MSRVTAVGAVKNEGGKKNNNKGMIKTKKFFQRGFTTERDYRYVDIKIISKYWIKTTIEIILPRMNKWS